jgi:hypothetical protein
MQFGMLAGDLQRRGHDDFGSMVATHGIERDSQFPLHIR